MVVAVVVVVMNCWGSGVRACLWGGVGGGVVVVVVVAFLLAELSRKVAASKRFGCRV